MAPRTFQQLLADHARAPTPTTTRFAILAPGQIRNHPWISFGGETLALSINLTEKKKSLRRDIDDFNGLVRLYAVYTKICLVSVKLPEYRFDVHMSDHSILLYNLVSVLNLFTRISRIEITICQPSKNFNQLRNACDFYRLEFKDWKLSHKVGTEKLEQINVGSEMDRRLNGWFKVNIAGMR